MKAKKFIAVALAAATVLSGMDAGMVKTRAEFTTDIAADRVETNQKYADSVSARYGSEETPSDAAFGVATPSNAERAAGADTNGSKRDGGHGSLLSFTDSSGLVTVETEEGILPEDAAISVEALDLLGDEEYADTMLSLWETAKKDLKNFLRVYAYDIRISDADGNDIRPAGEVTVTFHNVDLSGSENAGVYHIHGDGHADKVTAVYAGSGDRADGAGPTGTQIPMTGTGLYRLSGSRYGRAAVESGSDADGGSDADNEDILPSHETDITFSASVPGVYALAMDSGIAMTASDNDVYNVLVGESVTIVSNRGGPHYGWFSSDAGTATVKGNGSADFGMARSAAITGVKPGVVTITHYYGVFSVYSDTYTVVVSYKPDLILDAEITGSEVAYVRTNNGSYSASGNKFTAVPNGKTTVQNYMSEADHSVQMIVLAKPEKNHILVDLGEGEDKYSTSENYTQETAFRGKANWDKVIEEAAAKGYAAYFGFTKDGYASNNNNTIALRVRSLDPPEMDVTATPSKTEGVSLGDSLSFTVDVTPYTRLVDNYGGKSRTIDLTVEKKELRSVTINGKQYTNIKANDNGSFTVADYKATADDCREGEIRMTVDALITYSYDLNVKDRDDVTGKVRQTAVIEKSAAAVARIAKSNFDVKLSYVNMTHPGMAPVTGDKIQYTARIQNYGDLLRKLEFNDSRVRVAGRTLSMSGGAVTSFVYTYVVTDADVLAGKITNTATIKDNETGNTASDTLTIETGRAKRSLLTNVSLGKDTDQNRLFQAGETVPITVSVANTGNIAQQSVRLTGANLEFVEDSGYSVSDGGKTAVITGLAAGKTADLTARYVVRQEDVDDHSQIVSSVDVTGDTGTEYDPQSVTYTFFHLNRKPGLTVSIEIKNPKAVFESGDVIDYEIVVSNTGNTNLDLKIRDVITAWNTQGQETFDLSKTEQSGEGDGFSWDEAADTAALRLKPNAQHRFQYSYTVKAEDAAKRVMTNTVTVEEIKGRVSEASDTAAAHFADRPELKVTVTENTAGRAESPAYGYGKTIVCTVRVENTGSVELTDVRVSYTAEPAGTDPSGTASSDATAAWKIASLKPGEENAREFEVQHLVTEDDIAADGVKISASAETEYLLGMSRKMIEAEDSITLKTVAAETKITAAREALIGAGGNGGAGYGVTAGDVVPFLNTVRNEGNLTVSVVISDTFGMAGAAVSGTPGVTGISQTDGKVLATLKPGASLTIAYEYKVTEEDIKEAEESGKKIQSTVTVKDSEEEKVLASATAYVAIADGEKILSVRKTLTNGGETGFKAGETAEFDIVVTNCSSDNVNITVEEKLNGAVILGDPIIQGKAGKAGENGSGAGGRNAEFELVGDGAITVKNLADGESATIKARYTVTQDDIDKFAGKGEVLKNVVTVSVEGTGDGIQACAIIPLSTGNPKLSLTGYIVYPEGETGHKFTAGETAEFEIKVKNTGSITLTDLDVNELLDGAVFVSAGVGGNGNTVTNKGRTVKIKSLAPNETVTLKAHYVIKQEDMDSGADPVNRICAYYTGKIMDSAEIRVPLAGKKTALSVKKTVANEGGGTGEGGSFRAGDEVLFDVTVANTGNMTLRYLIVNELLAGAYIKEAGNNKDTGGSGEYGMPSYTLEGKGKAVIAQLSPGQTVTLKAAYRLTQADVDAIGGVTNTVTVKNGRPEDPHIDESAEAEIEGIERKTALVALVRLKNKGSGKDGAFKNGDVALFDIVLWNSGGTTLQYVTVTELLEGAKLLAGNGYTVDGYSAQIAQIAPGMTVTLRASYTVTKKDMEDSGELRNTLVVYGGKDRDGGQTISAVIPKDASSTRPSGSTGSGGGGSSGSGGSGNGSGGGNTGNDVSGIGPGYETEPETSAMPGTSNDEGANKAPEENGTPGVPEETGVQRNGNGEIMSPGTDSGKTQPEDHGRSDANGKDAGRQTPKTGDPGVLRYMVMLLISFAMCCACVIALRKKKRDGENPDNG